MKPIFMVALLVAALGVGCSDDSPTASKPTLDTAPHTHDNTFRIQEWDGDNWVNSGQNVSLKTVWRFISFVEVDGGVNISGGYTITVTNPTSKIVELGIHELKFYDLVGITIAEYDLRNDEFTIDPFGERTRTGTFNISLASLEVTELITRMGMFGTSGFQP